MQCKVLEFRRKETEVIKPLKQVTLTIKELFYEALPKSKDAYYGWFSCFKQYSIKNKQLEIFALINTIKINYGNDSRVGSVVGQANFIINGNYSVTIFDI